MKHSLYSTLVLALAGLLSAAPVAAGEGHAAHAGHAGHAAAQQQAWGIAGTPSQVDRTIEVSMDDRMRFTPENLQVKQGETIRFVHRNDGQVMHEFVLGTAATLDEHAQMMASHPGMAHDAPHMTHVAPGQSGEMIWTFNRAGEFDFACLIVGHYQAGMRGRIQVLAE